MYERYESEYNRLNRCHMRRSWLKSLYTIWISSSGYKTWCARALPTWCEVSSNLMWGLFQPDVRALTIWLWENAWELLLRLLNCVLFQNNTTFNISIQCLSQGGFHLPGGNRVICSAWHLVRNVIHRFLAHAYILFDSSQGMLALSSRFAVLLISDLTSIFRLIKFLFRLGQEYSSINCTQYRILCTESGFFHGRTRSFPFLFQNWAVRYYRHIGL